MVLLLALALTLAVAALLSQLAHRTVLSTSVLFLTVGFVIGPDVTGLVELPPGGDAVYWTAEVALFAVLFTDGLRTPLSMVVQGRRSLVRTLGVAMPLTMGLLVALGMVLLGLPWVEALLLAAVLAPTDPVLAEAIIGREGVPRRVRATLNLESGLNDGISLPVVAVTLATLGSGSASLGTAVLETVGGVALGVSVTWLVLRIERVESLGPSPDYERQLVIAIALLVFALASLTHANLFLAAFSSGITLVSVRPEIARGFASVGSTVVEVLKLAALMLTGVLLATDVLKEEGWTAWVYAGITLLLVRPLAIAVSMIGSPLSTAERAAVGWFGPKGFASVTYALLVLRSGVPYAVPIFLVAAATVAVSIVLHSSTDVLTARRLAAAVEEPTR